MTYICINELSLSDIILIEKKSNYQINYKLKDDIIIEGILLEIHGRLVKVDNEYNEYMIIPSENDNLRLLDEYLATKLPEYTSFIQKGKNIEYIEIKNHVLNKELLNRSHYHLNITGISKYNNTCYINII